MVRFDCVSAICYSWFIKYLTGERKWTANLNTGFSRRMDRDDNIPGHNFQIERDGYRWREKSI